MSFPTLVYRCPGKFQRKGGTYDYIAINDKEAFVAALSDGWYPSLPQAINADKIDIEIELQSVIDFDKKEEKEEKKEKGEVKPILDRSEVEKKAKKLGIGFNKATKTEVLINKIDMALDER